MKWVYFIASALVGVNVLGQSTVQLDEKNGFRAFTINKDLSVLKDNLEFIRTVDNDSAKLFQVKDPVVVNGLNGVTELVFYKDKLVEITVFFEKTSLENYMNLQKSLTQLYGTPVDDTNSKNKPTHLSKADRVYTWKGKTTGLQLNYEVNHKVIEMIYWGLNEVSEKI